MYVYERVKRYIKENSLEQDDIARKARIPRSAFHAMLNGRKIMYAEDLRAVCYALNVSADLFINIGSA